MIPKIIHQTWKENVLPDHFMQMAETWKNEHPTWEYKLWTDEMNRTLIRDFFPDFLDIYDNYPRNIQRADAVRYFILLKFGGVYVDLDFQCFKNISPLLEKDFVIGKEPMQHCERFAKDMILCNAFMASTANNEFLKSICKALKKYSPAKEITPVTILETTGPFLVTSVYDKFKMKDRISVLDSSYLYPLTMTEIREAYNGNINDEMQDRLNLSYGLHFFWGGW